MIKIQTLVICSISKYIVDLFASDLTSQLHLSMYHALYSINTCFQTYSRHLETIMLMKLQELLLSMTIPAGGISPREMFLVGGWLIFGNSTPKLIFIFIVVSAQLLLMSISRLSSSKVPLFVLFLVQCWQKNC